MNETENLSSRIETIKQEILANQIKRKDALSGQRDPGFGIGTSIEMNDANDQLGIELRSLVKDPQEIQKIYQEIQDAYKATLMNNNG